MAIKIIDPKDEIEEQLTDLSVDEIYSQLHAMIENARKIIQMAHLKGYPKDREYEISISFSEQNLNVDFVSIRANDKKKPTISSLIVKDAFAQFRPGYIKDFNASDFEDLTEDDIEEFNEVQAENQNSDVRVIPISSEQRIQLPMAFKC